MKHFRLNRFDQKKYDKERRRPDDAAEQHVGEAGADGKLDGVHGTVANSGEKKSKTHSRQTLGGEYNVRK